MLTQKVGKSKDAKPSPQTSNFLVHLKNRGRQDAAHAKFLEHISALNIAKKGRSQAKSGGSVILEHKS